MQFEADSAQQIARNRTQSQGAFEMMGEEQNVPRQNVGRRRRGIRARQRRERVGTNRAKSLIVICKEVLRRNLSEILNKTLDPNIQQIILDVWMVFRANKIYNKQIFTVMFNKEFSQKLAVDYEFKNVLDKYYETDYREAMRLMVKTLRAIMTETNIKQIIYQNEKMEKKLIRQQSLLQYISKFVSSELHENQIRFYRTEKYKQSNIYKFKSQSNTAWLEKYRYQMYNERSQGDQWVSH